MSEIRRIVDEFLHETILDVQAKIAPPELRAVLQANCTDHNWHPIRYICLKCGVTKEELFFADKRANDALKN